MQEASNGFEHGYMAVHDVRGLLEPVLERSMGLVRLALIRCSGVDDGAAERLLSETFATPRGLVPAIVMTRGQISREDRTRPPEQLDSAAVDLEWSSTTEFVAEVKDGETQISFTDEAKVTNLPANVSLELSGVGMRAAHVKPSRAFRVDVAVTRSDGTTEIVDPT
jgi:hypothetical protein